jgi:hypothetical protein
LFFAIGVVLINWFASNVVWDWRVALIAAGMASLLWAFVLRLLNVGGFIRMMKEK